MKTISILACGAVAATLLAGCASGGYGEHVTSVGVGYDGFYDDYYGPFNDGYWDRDGAFYYMDAGGIRHRDEGGHFRREAAPGFHAVHGHGRAAAPGEHRQR